MGNFLFRWQRDKLGPDLGAPTAVDQQITRYAIQESQWFFDRIAAPSAKDTQIGFLR